MTLTEFPVVNPAPGSVLVRVSRANVCGSDLHFWRGDARLQSWNRQDGAIIGHEKTGVVYALGDGVVTDFASAPLAVGDRVVHQYFAPCGRCRACLRGMTPACPVALGRMFTDPHQPPHFNGLGFGDTVVIQGAGGLGAYATAVAKNVAPTRSS